MLPSTQPPPPQYAASPPLPPPHPLPPTFPAPLRTSPPTAPLTPRRAALTATLAPAALRTNRAALGRLLRRELKALPRATVQARGSPNAKAYLRRTLLPAVAGQVVATRPMLWASLCRTRDAQALRPEARARALELLAGGELLGAIGRLDVAGVREKVSAFVEELRGLLLQADQVPHIDS